MSRPDFGTYFLNIACEVAKRSEDPHIKHGAIIVDNNTNQIIGTGYNGLIKGLSLDLLQNVCNINVADRSIKRQFMIHAEENAILNCPIHPSRLIKGASLYVTAKPCLNCIQRVIQFGVKYIHYIDRAGSITNSVEVDRMREEIVIHTESFIYPYSESFFVNKLKELE